MKDFLKNFFSRRSLIAHFLWIAVIVYALVSVILLILAINRYGHASEAGLNPEDTALFTVSSLLLVVLVACYHLSSLVRRRKRRSDRQRISRAKFIRAKHRFSSRSGK